MSSKTSKLLRYASVTFNLISLVIILIFSYSVITYRGDMLTDFFEMGLLLEMKKDDYYEKMNEKNYNNVKIIYNNDLEPTLPLIEKYIEEISKKNNTLLGINTSDKLTIQIDYDEEVFLMRTMLLEGNHNSNTAGYYNQKSNTIYLYTNSPVRDVLMDMPHASISDGSISISDSSFKDHLFHEYTHYAIDIFLEDNNIDKNSVPLWFEEGICEYTTGNDIYFGKDLEYISLKNLQTYKGFNNEIGNLQANIYEQSKIAVLKIVNEKGENVLKDMILSCKDKDFKTVIQEYINCSFEEFENNLQLYIKEDKFGDIAEDNEGDMHINTKIKCLEDYIKYDENNIAAYEFLGTLYESKKESIKTINLFKYATEKNPKEYILWHRLGLAYEDIGESVLAKESFDKAKLLKNKNI
ncbi:tetratricopeptide repeat protein [Romboutsia sp.]|uniref:tetratricopeptide repeat protein n=1 Tax=Romboutsia sp. TaxID=1965302 RepID=UPI003F67964A